MVAVRMNLRLCVLLILLLSIALSVEAGRKRSNKKKGKCSTAASKTTAANKATTAAPSEGQQRSYWDIFFDQVINGPHRQQQAAARHMSDDLRRPFVLLSVRGPNSPDLRSAMRYQAGYTLGADPLGHLLHDGGDLNHGIVAAPLPVKIRPIDPFFHHPNHLPV